ncbi:MAG: hypothetical protein DWQ34_11215 [Planctomycetota bacterium]|nr:MAG: hypothetical protein DWQ34_11215 [Planctomycetota bacterium]REK29712.1 MAG: hypothetical protein DWQ41_03485 [Planctomycetota bacterium]REK30467.1 MAG: hypothetical protein DWQ45_21550 [Planctomycetota bacterium]
MAKKRKAKAARARPQKPSVKRQAKPGGPGGDTRTGDAAQTPEKTRQQIERERWEESSRAIEERKQRLDRVLSACRDVRSHEHDGSSESHAEWARLVVALAQVMREEIGLDFLDEIDTGERDTPESQAAEVAVDRFKCAAKNDAKVDELRQSIDPLTGSGFDCHFAFMFREIIPQAAVERGFGQSAWREFVNPKPDDTQAGAPVLVDAEQLRDVERIAGKIDGRLDRIQEAYEAEQREHDSESQCDSDVSPWHSPGESPPQGWAGPLNGTKMELAKAIRAGQPRNLDAHLVKTHNRQSMWGRKEIGGTFSLFFKTDQRFREAEKTLADLRSQTVKANSSGA